MRNSYDLNAMSVPMKYRELGDFHEYYSGLRQAPYLTIFVGGNHEASNHLFELYYGGWVAHKIYYLGAANVIWCGPLRICGLSGIWKGYNYRKPHYERLPYTQDDVKSIYHVRELDVRKLLQLRSQVDIGISHDWPKGVEWMGDWKGLFARKSHFESDARNGSLGSFAAKAVMDRLKPQYWLSAHLHCKFSAVVDYSSDQSVVNSRKEVEPKAVTDFGNMQNTDEIEIDLEDMDVEHEDLRPIDRKGTDTNERITTTTDPGNSVNVSDDLRAQLPESFKRSAPNAESEQEPLPTQITNHTTRFLALDKCLPNRKAIQLLQIEAISEAKQESISKPFGLRYDKEWLAIVRVFSSELVLGDPNARIPPPQSEMVYRTKIEEDELWIQDNLVSQDRMSVPDNFQLTAPIYDEKVGIATQELPKEYTNPQTEAFCRMLGIANPFDIPEDERQLRMQLSHTQSSSNTHNRRGMGGRGRGRGGFRSRRGPRW